MQKPVTSVMSPLTISMGSPSYLSFFPFSSHSAQSLPDQQHCYFLNGDAPVQDGHSLQGTLVSKIPFRHPAQVPALLDVIRHQAAANTLIGSCVKRTFIKDGA